MQTEKRPSCYDVSCFSFKTGRQRIRVEKGILKTPWKIHRCKRLQFPASSSNCSKCTLNLQITWKSQYRSSFCIWFYKGLMKNLTKLRCHKMSRAFLRKIFWKFCYIMVSSDAIWMLWIYVSNFCSKPMPSQQMADFRTPSTWMGFWNLPFVFLGTNCSYQPVIMYSTFDTLTMMVWRMKRHAV